MQMIMPMNMPMLMHILNDLCFKDLIFDPRSYLIEDDQIHDKSSQSGTIYYYDETANKLYQSFEELATIE